MAIAQRGIAAVVAEDDGTARRPARHDRELMLTYYREMLLIRRFEEKAGQLYGMGLIGGFCHLYIGQEAVAVGVQHALKDGDSVITAYRDHGHMLATGMDPRRVMAELTGRVTGYSKGKGGSMHMFARDKRFYGGHGIVGACVPLGTGIAFAHKYREDGGVCVTYLGDGAVNQGQVYESFNMAALWKLPVVYVIENNKYGMGTSVERASASTELHRRGEAYGIQGRAIDGMDVLAVREAAAEAVAHARAQGPTILEAMTYRYRGHSMSDPAKYRSRQEVQEVRTERDPIDRLRKTMLDTGLADEDSLKTIDKEIRAIVNEAASFAQDSPEPGPDELYKDVYLDV
jgi:pyruvate dehydrogenase E1 component alpha subunit